MLPSPVMTRSAACQDSRLIAPYRVRCQRRLEVRPLVKAIIPPPSPPAAPAPGTSLIISAPKSRFTISAKRVRSAASNQLNHLRGCALLRVRKSPMLQWVQ